MSIFWTQKEGCYKDGAKSKTYSVTIKSDIHKSQIAFQESEYFKEKSKERYKIEAKNSELKPDLRTVIIQLIGSIYFNKKIILKNIKNHLFIV